MSSRIRRRVVVLAIVSSLCAAACATILGFEGGITLEQDAGNDVIVTDARVDLDAGRTCDMDAEFAFKDVPGLSKLGWAVMRSATLSEDERELYFYGTRADGGALQIHKATWNSSSNEFDNIKDVPIAEPSLEDLSPSLSMDGLKLIFARKPRDVDASLFDSLDLFAASRSDKTQDFKATQPLDNVNSPGTADQNPFLAADGGELWFSSYREGVPHLYRARATFGSGFGKVERIESPNPTSSREENPVLSADGKTLFYSAIAAGGVRSNDIWEARRATEDGTFAGHRLVKELSSDILDYPSWLSPDGCRLYMHRGSRGDGIGSTIYVGERKP